MLDRLRWTVPLTLLLGAGGAAGGCTDDGGNEGESDASTETGETETDGESGTDTDGETDTDTDTGGVEPVVEWPTLDCDPLVPEYCAFPFPNNVFSTDDEGAETGRRLALSAEMMPKAVNHEPDPSRFNLSDGFSPASTPITFIPGATTTGLADPLTIDSSLADDSPTILLDAETGERVPHWAELDMSHGDDDRRAFMIRPAHQFEPGRRYIVAIRGLVDGAGEAIAASEGFAALRDDLPSEDPAIDDRRGLYADIFERLSEAGVGREDLQLAWDFTTASATNTTERAVHMRDEGLDLVGPDGPDYEVTAVEMNPAPGLAMRIEIDMTVPLYLDSPDAGGRMQLGDDGLPEPTGTAVYPVLVHVPESAFETPAKLVAYGHGLLGSRQEIQAAHLQAFAADGNVIVFATDWVGMAQDDLGHIADVLSTGRIDDFHTVPDRLQQGFLNAFVAMRMMRTNFAADPIMQGPDGSVVDASESWYFGGSQGGIFGSSYMALSPDVFRGALAVPGQPYNLLLNRSIDFANFFTLIDAVYPDKLDLRFLLELTQIEWDRAEPSGYSRHVIQDPLPGTAEKEVLTLVAIGDHQVTTLGAHVMARELGIPQIGPANRPDLFAIDVVEQPYMGSAMVEYDFGLPPEPLENVPMTEGEDPHGKLADIPIAAMTVEQFLRTGVVETFCDGVCDPE